MAAESPNRDTAEPGPPRGGRPVGLSSAGWLSRLTFQWATPLIKMGSAALKEGEPGKKEAPRRGLELHDAEAFMEKRDTSRQLAAEFDEAWAKEEACRARRGPDDADADADAGGRLIRRPRRLAATLWRLHKGTLALQCLWTVLEILARLAGPLLLEAFLTWLAGSRAAAGGSGDPAEFPLWQGWALVAAMGVQSVTQALVHTKLFWLGMRMGLHARTQCMIAVHSKVLRLNGCAVSDFSAGKVVNLVSNDVARFDEAATMWNFLWGGPLELVAVTGLLVWKLGWGPGLAGVAALALLVPVQSALSRVIHRLRALSARVTDERVRLMGEIIGGALAAKMHCWEDPFAAKLRALRAEEVSHKGRTAQIRAASMALQFALTPLVTFATFAAVTAGSSGGDSGLDIPLVFFAIGLLQLPKLYIATFFVRGVETVTELRVALSRLGAFLELEEPPAPARIDGDCRKPGEEHEGGPAVALRGADFSWAEWHGRHAEEKGEEDKREEEQAEAEAPLRAPAGATLSGIRLEVAPGELVGVAGEVGSGKSSLLGALLGEMQPLLSGGGSQEEEKEGPLVKGSVAYCAQVPWVMAATLEENVLFGKAMDRKRYEEVTEACALTDDIAMLPAGDETELGERGVNLSGGQKARLALARAAYSGAEVLLLDDPLSAVDSRVGRHIFRECIGPSGVMSNKTRLLVTHQKQFLPLCDRVAVMRKGRVEALGTWEELKPLGLVELEGVEEMAGNVIEDYGEPRQSMEAAREGTADVAPDAVVLAAPGALQKTFSVAVEGGLVAMGDEPASPASSYAAPSRASSLLRFMPSFGARDRPSGSPSMLRKQMSMLVRGRGGGRGGEPAAAAENGKVGQLVASEGRAQGGVPWGVYLSYARYAGPLSTALVMSFMVLGAGLFFYSQFWLGQWGAAPPEEQSSPRWLQVYGTLTAVIVAMAITRSAVFFERTLAAGSNMHSEMAINVLRAPLRFFHTNPTGRVLNRFSKDLGVTDDLLPVVLFDTLQIGFVIFGAFALIMLAAWPAVFVIIPLGFVFVMLRRVYIVTSREVKRFEAVSRSPLYASFSAMLKGLATVRAYRAQDYFHSAFLADQNINTSWFFCFLATARWIGFRFDAISAMSLTALGAAAMLLRDTLSLTILGVALTNALELSAALQWCVRQSAEVENNMTAVERLLEYARLEREAPTIAEGGAVPPEGWPHAPQPADVVFEGLTATYSSALPPVLKGLSFTVPAGTSCGIVGRTGSGKSSLMLTLFRMIDTTAGRITIGGVDISSIGVDALRRQLAIIPQDPVLFSGSLRANMDPFDKHEDAAIWDVLRLVQLSDHVGAAGGLGMAMSEGGDNFSVGQRQLLCLARALLQDASILALDEATANVDRETDAVVQRAVRECMRGAGGHRRSLLVIAHRIDTIMDCDQLLVLSKGKLAEAGAPQELMAKEGGIFAKLVAAAAAGGMAAPAGQVAAPGA